MNTNDSGLSIRRSLLPFFAFVGSQLLDEVLGVPLGDGVVAKCHVQLLRHYRDPAKEPKLLRRGLAPLSGDLRIQEVALARIFEAHPGQDLYHQGNTPCPPAVRGPPL
jgi:hypothetical protein